MLVVRWTGYRWRIHSIHSALGSINEKDYLKRENSAQVPVSYLTC